MKEEMQIPKQAELILDTLNEAGYEAYVVGGCVRDALLKREPGDWDITTSAAPKAVKELFCRTIDTGIAHGTVTVMINGEGYEVTTYRVDGEYRDGRHPQSVSFTASLEEDLKRRDFTINAMAYHPNQGTVDLFCGREDLQNGIIRCVGDAKSRFTEDALRMMRAVRFSGQLGFEIEEQTAEAIKELAPRLEMVSRERIQAELVKLILSKHPQRLSEIFNLNMSDYVLPELNTLSAEKRKMAIKRVCLAPAKKHIRLAALFSNKTQGEQSLLDKNKDIQTVDEKNVSKALHGLKFDNDTIKKTTTLVRFHDIKPLCDKTWIRRMMSRMSPQLFFDLISLLEATEMEENEDIHVKEEHRELDEIRRLAKEIMEAGDCLCMKDLAVDGKKLIQMGIKPGKQIGNILDAMLEYVLEDPARNNIESLILRMKQYIL